MTEQDLIRANALKKEIDELENFIHVARNVWAGRLIKRDAVFIFKSNPYGIYNSKEFYMNTKIKNQQVV